MSHEIVRIPEGVVSVFLHRGAPRFIQLGDDPLFGFFDFGVVEMVDERHVKNMIVNNASKFIAKRMRPGTSWGTGISHLEVGTGVGTGTPQSPQGENPAQTALRVPLARKAIGSWTYIDGSGNPTESETNVVKYSTTFLEGEANGGLVEMGLFGGDAGSTLGSGYMFNYKTFPVINKDSTMQLTIEWKITF